VPFSGNRVGVFENPRAMPYQVQEIGRVLAVMDRKGGIETDLVRVSAQQPGADRVKGAGPAEPIGRPGGAPSCGVAQEMTRRAGSPPQRLAAKRSSAEPGADPRR
jgi:hypothetical protein